MRCAVGDGADAEEVVRSKTAFDEQARLDALRDSFERVWEGGLRDWVARNWFGRERSANDD